MVGYDGVGDAQGPLGEKQHLSFFGLGMMVGYDGVGDAQSPLWRKTTPLLFRVGDDGGI
jgi:hypothetical protein